MIFPRFSLGVTGLLFIGLGVAFLLDPHGMADVIGVRADRPRQVVELRAMYGGFELGLGIFFLIAIGRTRWIRAALAAQTLGFLGLAGGRLVGMMFDGWDRLNLGFFAIELTGALMGAVAFRQALATFMASRNAHY